MHGGFKLRNNASIRHSLSWLCPWGPSWLTHETWTAVTLWPTICWGRSIPMPATLRLQHAFSQHALGHSLSLSPASPATCLLAIKKPSAWHLCSLLRSLIWQISILCVSGGRPDFKAGQQASHFFRRLSSQVFLVLLFVCLNAAGNFVVYYVFIAFMMYHFAMTSQKGCVCFPPVWVISLIEARERKCGICG